jgi:gluconokinase
VARVTGILSGVAAPELTLAIDIGTTSAKAVAYDCDGGEHGAGDAGYPLHEPAYGRAEQDPAQLLEGAVAAARAAVADAGAQRIAGIGCSAAMHALVGLDADDAPVTPLLTWADSRAAAQAERLRAEHPQLHARTGTPPHPMAPLPKLMWFAEHAPDLHARVRRWVGIKELLIHRLTGEWVVDVSCASGTGLMASETGDWDEEALEVAQVRREQLCPIVAADHRLSLREDGIGLAAGTPVIVGAGDGPLANVGLGAVSPGVVACSIGTSGALRMTVPEPGIDPDAQLFCYALAPRRWVLGGAINNGGSVLPWLGTALAPDLGEHAERELLALAAHAPAGSAGLLMLPYLLSERAPHWSALPRGAYIGLRHFHGREHMIRAAVEGVCQQLALVLDSIAAAGHDVSEIRATGGFARSPWWRQLLSDVFGMPIGYTDGGQGSALGAALLAFAALGLVDSIERAADLVTITERHDPDPEAAAVYAGLRPVFAELYDDLTPAFRALARAERQQEDIAPTSQTLT